MAAAAPAAGAASSEAPVATATADLEAADEDSREVRVLQSLRGKICKRGPPAAAAAAGLRGRRARGGGGAAPGRAWGLFSLLFKMSLITTRIVSSAFEINHCYVSMGFIPSSDKQQD